MKIISRFYLIHSFTTIFKHSHHIELLIFLLKPAKIIEHKFKMTLFIQDKTEFVHAKTEDGSDKSTRNTKVLCVFVQRK